MAVFRVTRVTRVTRVIRFIRVIRIVRVISPTTWPPRSAQPTVPSDKYLAVW